MKTLLIPTLEPAGIKIGDVSGEYPPFAQITVIGTTYQSGMDLDKFQTDIKMAARETGVHVSNFGTGVFLNADISAWEQEFKDRPHMKEVFEAALFNMKYNMEYLHPNERKTFYGTVVGMNLMDKPHLVTFDHIGACLHPLMIPYYLHLIMEIAKNNNLQVIIYTRNETLIHDFADAMLNKSSITGAFYRITRQSLRPDADVWLTKYSMENIQIAREQHIPIL